MTGICSRACREIHFVFPSTQGNVAHTSNVCGVSFCWAQFMWGGGHDPNNFLNNNNNGHLSLRQQLVDAVCHYWERETKSEMGCSGSKFDENAPPRRKASGGVVDPSQIEVKIHTVISRCILKFLFHPALNFLCETNQVKWTLIMK